MSMYMEPGKLTLNGRPFTCSKCAAGEVFTVRHIHNPYGSDMCEDVARCAGCGTEWREYVGKFDRPKTPLAQGKI